MKTNIFPLALTIIAIVGATAQQLEYDGKYYRGEIQKEYDIPESGSLNMKNINGDVKIVGETRNNISVTERYRISAYSEASAQNIYDDSHSKYIYKGKTLTIEGTSGSRRYQSNFLVRVPTKFNLDVQASGGDIVTETVSGQIDLRTSGGDIDVVDLNGKIDLHTSGGDLTIRQCRKDLLANTSGGDISINKFSGQIQAKTSGGDISLENLDGNGEVKTSGGDIYLNKIKGEHFSATTSGGDIGADYINTDLELNTSGGDINVGQSHANLWLHTSGGDIQIDEVEGNLEANTSGGDISVQYVKGGAILHTSGGDIELERALKNVKATTSGGDIVLSYVTGSVYARTSGGDIELEKHLEKANKDNSIDLASSGGDISIAIPDNMPADIFARITIYHKWDNNQIRTDFPLTVNREIKDSKVVITGQGSINGGGDSINLETSDGDIIIHKLMQ
jgi:DUF4097 and DUF4098 domain-containing protein YvlB